MVFVKKFTVHGMSMHPFLSPNDIVLASSLPYMIRQPQKQEVIVCSDPRDQRPLIKRIANVNKTQVYVLGDNPSASTDSRTLGWIEKKAIIGKVVFVQKANKE